MEQPIPPLAHKPLTFLPVVLTPPEDETLTTTTVTKKTIINTPGATDPNAQSPAMIPGSGFDLPLDTSFDPRRAGPRFGQQYPDNQVPMGNGNFPQTIPNSNPGMKPAGRQSNPFNPEINEETTVNTLDYKSTTAFTPAQSGAPSFGRPAALPSQMSGPFPPSLPYSPAYSKLYTKLLSEHYRLSDLPPNQRHPSPDLQRWYQEALQEQERMTFAGSDFPFRRLGSNQTIFQSFEQRYVNENPADLPGGLPLFEQLQSQYDEDLARERAGMGRSPMGMGGMGMGGPQDDSQSDEILIQKIKAAMKGNKPKDPRNMSEMDLIILEKVGEAKLQAKEQIQNNRGLGPGMPPPFSQVTTTTTTTTTKIFESRSMFERQALDRVYNQVLQEHRLPPGSPLPPELTENMSHRYNAIIQGAPQFNGFQPTDPSAFVHLGQLYTEDPRGIHALPPPSQGRPPSPEFNIFEEMHNRFLADPANRRLMGPVPISNSELQNPNLLVPNGQGPLPPGYGAPSRGSRYQSMTEIPPLEQVNPSGSMQPGIINNQQRSNLLVPGFNLQQNSSQGLLGEPQNFQQGNPGQLNTNTFRETHTEITTSNINMVGSDGRQLPIQNMGQRLSGEISGGDLPSLPIIVSDPLPTVNLVRPASSSLTNLPLATYAQPRFPIENLNRSTINTTTVVREHAILPSPIPSQPVIGRLSNTTRIGYSTQPPPFIEARYGISTVSSSHMPTPLPPIPISQPLPMQQVFPDGAVCVNQYCHNCAHFCNKCGSVLDHTDRPLSSRGTSYITSSQKIIGVPLHSNPSSLIRTEVRSISPSPVIIKALPDHTRTSVVTTLQRPAPTYPQLMADTPIRLKHATSQPILSPPILTLVPSSNKHPVITPLNSIVDGRMLNTFNQMFSTYKPRSGQQTAGPRFGTGPVYDSVRELSKSPSPAPVRVTTGFGVSTNGSTPLKITPYNGGRGQTPTPSSEYGARTPQNKQIIAPPVVIHSIVNPLTKVTSSNPSTFSNAPYVNTNTSRIISQPTIISQPQNIIHSKRTILTEQSPRQVGSQSFSSLPPLVLPNQASQDQTPQQPKQQMVMIGGLPVVMSDTNSTITYTSTTVTKQKEVETN